jgi:hypothetical protein
MEEQKKEIEDLKKLIKFEEIFSSNKIIMIYKYFLLKNINKLSIQPGKLLLFFLFLLLLLINYINK